METLHSTISVHRTLWDICKFKYRAAAIIYIYIYILHCAQGMDRTFPPHLVRMEEHATEAGHGSKKCILIICTASLL